MGVVGAAGASEAASFTSTLAIFLHPEAQYTMMSKNPCLLMANLSDMILLLREPQPLSAQVLSANYFSRVRLPKTRDAGEITFLHRTRFRYVQVNLGKSFPSAWNNERMTVVTTLALTDVPVSTWQWFNHPFRFSCTGAALTKFPLALPKERNRTLGWTAMNGDGHIASGVGVMN